MALVLLVTLTQKQQVKIFFVFVFYFTLDISTKLFTFIVVISNPSRNFSFLHILIYLSSFVYTISFLVSWPWVYIFPTPTFFVLWIIQIFKSCFYEYIWCDIGTLGHWNINKTQHKQTQYFFKSCTFCGMSYNKK